MEDRGSRIQRNTLFTSLYLNSIATRNTREGLIRHSEESLSGIAEKVSGCIEAYRHLTYLLSTDPLIVKAILCAFFDPFLTFSPILELRRDTAPV